MFLTYLMLVVALCLSAIAAFYSIIGLTAIFAAAVIPVAVMGTVLEIAKLTVTVWLHEYWHRCKRAMKIYLVPAVGVLMLITSMGIFGFLSKAHLDQAVPTGDVAAQVSLLDEKIKTQRDNIEAARRAITQMDAAVDQTLGRSSDEKGADKAAALRRSQARERASLQGDIARAQTEIARLNEQRAPIAANLRKVEAEVGPIKYIAALIYGDNPDANLLEKAVRWVIIILVVVFDPLAIFMLLAATESYKWEKYGKEGDPQEQDDAPPKQPVNDAVAKTKIWAEDLWQRVRRPKNATVDDDATVTSSVDGQSTGADLGVQPVVEVVGQSSGISKEQWGGADLTERLHKPVPSGVPVYVDMPDIVTPQVEIKYLGDADDEVPDVKVDPITQPPKDQERSFMAGRRGEEKFARTEEELPEVGDQFAFGSDLPISGTRGDLFMRTDTLPTTLYKYNSEKWITVDKNQNDRYTYDDQYIDFLISKISSGEYDAELLTDAERLQIEQRLKKDFS